MKRAFPIIASASIIAAGLAIAGPLTPPAGPVASTYKTLSDVQPRTPIDHLPFTISQSGSYYLTRNLTAAAAGDQIAVNNYNVAIDLNGFTLTGMPSTGAAIVSQYLGLAVRNGFIQNWGEQGIYAGNGGATIDRVCIESCGNVGIQAGIGSVITGCRVRNSVYNGIAAGQASRIVDCTVIGNNTSNTAGDGGIYAGPASRVTGCSAFFNHGYGLWLPIDASASGCSAHANTASGFRVSDRAVIEQCFSTNNGADGFTVDGLDVTIRGCIGRDNTGHGLLMGSMGTVSHNVFQGNVPSAGIYLAGYGTRVEDNDLANNHYGIQSITGVSSNNLITGNTAHGNSLGYPVSTSDIVAPEAFNLGANAWGSVSPWANFTFN